MKNLSHRSPSLEALEGRSLLAATAGGHLLNLGHAAFGPVQAGAGQGIHLPGMPGTRPNQAFALRAERAAIRHTNLLRFLEMRGMLRQSPMMLPAAPAPILSPAANPAPSVPPPVVAMPPVAANPTAPLSAAPIVFVNVPPASTSPATPINSGLNMPSTTNLPSVPVIMPPAAPTSTTVPTATDSPSPPPSSGGMPETVLPGGPTSQAGPTGDQSGGTSIAIGSDGTAQVSGTLADAGSSDVYSFQAPSSGRLTFSFPPNSAPVKLTAQDANGTVLVTILMDRPNFISYITVAAGSSYTLTLTPIGSTPASYAVAMMLR
jgi:hypothetical protein